MLPMMRSSRFLLALSLLLVVPTALSEPAPAGKKHPALVAAAEAKCATCHADVLKGRTVHPDAQSCSRCHVISGSGPQTVVRFVSPLPKLCLDCHSNLADAAGGKLKVAHAPVTDSCTNCHLPHAGDEPRLLKAPARELCLSCHEADSVARAHPVPLGRVDCGSCHAPHGSDARGMLAGRFVHPPFGDRSCDACHQKGRAVRARSGKRSAQAATCFACHSDLEEKFGRGIVHVPVKEGRCAACHDPHLSSEPKLVKEKGAALCAGCHAEIVKKATGKGGHAPAKKGCVSCHDPHRSDSPKLLARTGPALCAGCHDPAKKELRKKHLGADLAKLDCSGCHDPHGSGEGKLLLSRSVHAPFAEGACDSCHEAASAVKLAEGGGKALCLICHTDVEGKAAKAKVRHAALDGDCTLCHTPHASSHARLVRGKGGEACGSCHDEKLAGKGEFAHGVIASLGCEACHEPHGGANRKLLRVSGNDLCLGCHDSARLKPGAGSGMVKLLGRFEVLPADAEAIKVIAVGPSGPVNHPVAGHRCAGPPLPSSRTSQQARTTFQGAMTCLTCHDPHKGKSSRLLVKGAVSATESCLQCHPK